MNIEKLRALWDGHASAVHTYLLRLTKSEADAADFLQDVFCRLGRQPELVERLTDEPRGYLLRLAHNVVVDQARRTQVRERIFARLTAAGVGDFAAAEDPDQALLRQELLAALDELPAEQRFVVHARLWKMRTLDDIARELGVSINTAGSRYRYGVDKMRARLRSLYEDFAPRASTKPIHSMKNHSANPFSDPNADQPIIRPLEQRRVPSATGAAFALPLPPDELEDATVSNEAEFIDEEIIDSELVDPIPLDKDGMINFDDVLVAIEDGGVVEGEEGVEEFNPDVIFWTLFNDGGEATGELTETADADGDGIDDATGEAIAKPVYYTLDMIKRGGGGAAVSGEDTGGEIEGEVSGDEGGMDPNIYYMSAGGPAPTATGGESTDSGHHESAGDAVPASAPHGAPHHAPAPLATAPAGTSEGTEVSLHAETPASFGSVAPGNTPAFIEVGHLDLHAEFGVSETDLEASTFTASSAPLDFGSGHSELEAGALDATHGDFTVDSWIPAHEGSEELLTLGDGLTAGVPDDAVIAPVDAIVPAPEHHTTMSASALAMAATGATLHTRDAQHRRRDEQA